MVMRSMRASAKWIMLFLALAFVGWMVFDVGMDVSGQGGVTLTDAVVRVNGTKIDLQTYYNALRDAQEQRRQQGIEAANTLEEQRALEDAVIENLIQEVLLSQEYRRRGIRVSNDEIIAAAQTSPPPELFGAPQFQTDGQFDVEKYRRYLASNIDPNLMVALEARYRSEIPRIKLYEQLTADLYLPDAKLWQMYRDDNDSVTIRLVELLPATLVPDSEVVVEQADLDAYYRANSEDFRRPTLAYTSYISTSRRTNAADTAAAIARAEALRQEILDGGDFAQVAQRESADTTSRVNGGDLGWFPTGGLVPEFEAATRALRNGQISEPVQTDFGYHIIRREAVTADSIHASHILIPVELADDHLDMVEARADTMDLYGAEQEEGAALDEVADMLSVPIQQAPVVAQGSRVQLGGELVPDVGLWAFEVDPGETSQVIETPNAYYLFRVDSIKPAGVPPLAEVEGAVRRAVRAEKKWERAQQIAGQIAERLRNGQHLMEAALENLLSATTLGPMTRTNPAPRLRNVPEVIGASFGLGVGEPSGAIESGNAIYFVEPVAVTLADSTQFVSEMEIMRAQLLQAARQDRVQRFLLSMRASANIVDNRREIERAQRDFERSADQNPFNPLGF